MGQRNLFSASSPLAEPVRVCHDIDDVSQSTDHLFTTDEREKEKLTQEGYKYEGVACYVWPTMHAAQCVSQCKSRTIKLAYDRMPKRVRLRVVTAVISNDVD